MSLTKSVFRKEIEWGIFLNKRNESSIILINHFQSLLPSRKSYINRDWKRNLRNGLLPDNQPVFKFKWILLTTGKTEDKISRIRQKEEHFGDIAFSFLRMSYLPYLQGNDQFRDANLYCHRYFRLINNFVYSNFILYKLNREKKNFIIKKFL